MVDNPGTMLEKWTAGRWPLNPRSHGVVCFERWIFFRWFWDSFRHWRFMAGLKNTIGRNFRLTIFLGAGWFIGHLAYHPCRFFNSRSHNIILDGTQHFTVLSYDIWWESRCRICTNLDILSQNMSVQNITKFNFHANDGLTHRWRVKAWKKTRGKMGPTGTRGYLTPGKPMYFWPFIGSP